MQNHYRGILIFFLLVLFAFFTPTSKTQANQPDAGRFDWRDQGYDFPVHDQLGCDAGYAFAGVDAVQSAIWKKERIKVDLSENNAIRCTWYALNNYGGLPHTCNGGDFRMIINLFTQKGLVLESCDPLNLQNLTCNQTCDAAYYVTEWQYINKFEQYIPVDVIKALLVEHGPLYAQMDSNIAGFEYFKGNGIIDEEDSLETENNHGVLIVGWDEISGKKVWIAKNSFGTEWGNDGYFYVAQNRAGVGKYVGFVTGWEKSTPTRKLYYYDHAGHTNQIEPDGVLDKKGSALAIFKIEEEEVVRSIEFWSTDKSTVITKVYTQFENNKPINLVHESLSINIPNAGYYTIYLPPLDVSAGDDLVIELNVTNFNNFFPIATDSIGPELSDHTWFKNEYGLWESFTMRNLDAAIRLRTWAKTEGFTRVFLPIISR